MQIATNYWPPPPKKKERKEWCIPLPISRKLFSEHTCIHVQECLYAKFQTDMKRILLNLLFHVLSSTLLYGYFLKFEIDFQDRYTGKLNMFRIVDHVILKETCNYFLPHSLENLGSLFVNESWYQQTVKQIQFQNFLSKVFTDKIIMLEGKCMTV